MPNAKKKKLASKGKEAAQLSQHPSSPPLPTSSPSFNTTVNATQESAEPGSSQTVVVAAATSAPKKPAKVAKNRYLKPQRLSPGCKWLWHRKHSPLVLPHSTSHSLDDSHSVSGGASLCVPGGGTRVRPSQSPQ